MWPLLFRTYFEGVYLPPAFPAKAQGRQPIAESRAREYDRGRIIHHP